MDFEGDGSRPPRGHPHPHPYQPGSPLAWGSTPAEPPHVPRLHELRVVGIGRRASPTCASKTAGRERGMGTHKPVTARHHVACGQGRGGGRSVSRAATTSRRSISSRPARQRRRASQAAPQGNPGSVSANGRRWVHAGKKKEEGERRTADHHIDGGAQEWEGWRGEMPPAGACVPPRQRMAERLH